MKQDAELRTFGATEEVYNNSGVETTKGSLSCGQAGCYVAIICTIED